MDTLTPIENHEFKIEQIQDAKCYLSDKKFSICDIAIPKCTKFDELEYYIHNVGFYTYYFIKLLKQLDFAVDFLSNYDYKPNLKYNRIDHLTYNIENYIIRYQSVLDRLLQLINSVFHLTVDENNVNNNVIMSNLKVKKSAIPSKFSPIKNQIRKFCYDRNTIIHKNSYLEKRLREFEYYYSDSNNNIDNEVKAFRTRILKDYIKKNREKFLKNNQDLFKLIPDLFDELLIEYKKQREILIKTTRPNFT